MAYLCQVNFTELFAKLPTSSLQDWEAAARTQLKGKPLESINISSREGAQVAPYAIGTETGLVEGGSQGWVQFSSFSSDLKVSADLLLDSLNGGAQGLEISFQSLVGIAGHLKDIRFDFITLKLNQFSPSDQNEFVALIPEGQRSGVKLVIQLQKGVKAIEYQSIVCEFDEVSFLLSPKLPAGELDSFNVVLEGIKYQLSQDESMDFFTSYKVSLGVNIILAADYLINISYVHAVSLLFANMFNSFGFSQPLPRPYLYGRIVPEQDVESHEIYLIDATAKAVAGISGGLSALTIEAYPDADILVASRRARNIQNVLAIEGLLGIPLNALHGAAFFESTARDLISSIWPDY